VCNDNYQSKQLCASAKETLKEKGVTHLKGLSREKTALPPKKYIFFFACPLTSAPAQTRFIVTFFRTRYFFFIG
jgi:hypothetical protein